MGRERYLLGAALFGALAWAMDQNPLAGAVVGVVLTKAAGVAGASLPSAPVPAGAFASPSPSGRGLPLQERGNRR